MRYTNYKVHEWQDVAAAFERLIRIHNPNMFQREPNLNYLKDIYNNNLPSAMQHLFVVYFVDDKTNRNDPDIQMLINAYKQLQTVGYIGKGNKED